MNKKIRFSLLTLLVMLCGTVFADYQKVTATSDITDGEYLIVYEGGNVAFNGALETLDAVENTVGVEINEGKITSSDAIDAAVFTIDVTNGTLKSASGRYIGVSSNSNGLKQSADANVYTNSFAINEDGDAVISAVFSSSQMTMRFNAASNQNRFRYYKSGQQAIQLYKKVSSSGGGNTEPAYTIDFNTQIATSSHDFAIASNWGHVSGYDAAYDSNMSYNWSETAGVDGTGALLAYRQFKYDWGQSSSGVDVYDLLVTPLVKGNVSIAVKQYSGSNSYIEFYEMTDNGDGTFTRGDIINYTLGEEETLNQSTYCTATINVEDFARIGIRASYMYLDNFTAEDVNIIPEKGITIVSADPTATTGTIYWDQQADGKVLVKYTVTVKNTGDLDLTQGTEGYSVSIFNRDDNQVYVTTAVPQDLAVGATSDPFVVQAEVESSVWPNSYSYHSMDLKENLKGTILQRAQSHYRAYQSKFIFRAAGSTATSSITANEAWGTITESTTKSFEIYNDGLAPITIKSITLPEGFTSDNAPEIPSEGLVLNGKEKVTFNVTQDATSFGTYSGNLAIEYLSYGAEEATTYTLAFSATIIGANVWAVDFNNTKSGIVYPAGSIAEAGINGDYDYNSGTYNYWITGRTQSSYATGNNMFITPKLHANANESLAFDVKGAYGSSYYAKVYVSTDRKNWTQVAYYTQGETEGAEAIGYSNWYTKKVTFDAEGDYYVAFALYGTFKIDNLVGLEKVDVAHDLYIKSVSWPDASIKSGASQTKPSVDIIPLTDEAAENYTVKYFYGENVVEIASKALTASATSTTNFAASFTPVVDTSTTFPGTKVVFEFTDGTKFETETFDLTVTNEAIFHFVKTLPTSKWYEPTDYTTPIAFGKTNTADTQIFYVYNWGSAPLTVNSISLPEGFTTDVEFPQTVAAFDESNLSASALALPVTFSAAEAGTFGGDMVITYSGDQTFTLAVSGVKLDPSKFYANFDDGSWPAGSVYQKNISSSNGGTYNVPNYYITSSSATDNMFITPKLTAAAGDKLLFDAKLYSSYWSEGAIKVYAAATREEVLNAEEGTTRVQLFYASGEDTEADAALTTDYQTFEVPALAGDYFYGFEISNRPFVDELYGLAPAAVAHDWAIASSNIPAEAMQNVASTATVNVLNFGLTDEAADSYTATLFINGEAAATAETVALPMSHLLSDAGTQLSFNFRCPKAGTFPVYIEVKAGDYALATAPVDVVFVEEVAVADAIQVGTRTSSDRDHAIIDFYNMDVANRTSDILYTADQLNAFGIVAGTKITKLAFVGSTTTAKSINNSLTAWYGLSTGEITYNSPDKSAMTEVKIFDGTMDFATGANEIAIMLSEPIVYDGTSDLRLYFEGTKGGWASLSFDYDDNYKNMKWDNNGSMKSNPLLYVTVAAEPAVFSGTVKNAEGAAVENAAITLVSNDGENVQYAGTTDAEGAFSINVIQAKRTYEVTVAAGGDYENITTTIAFNGESKMKNFVVDVPLMAKYTTNPGFELSEAVSDNIGTSGDAQGTDYESTGWKLVGSAAWSNAAVFAYGSTAQLNGVSVPAADNEGNAGKALGITVGWGGAVTYQTSNAVTLPAGSYTLKAAAYNAGSAAQFKSMLGFVPTEGDAYVSTKNSFAMNEWVTDEITFVLNQDTEGKFQIGGQAISGGSGSNGKVFFDNLKLEFKSVLDGAIEALEAEIAKAEALRTEARTAGLEEFNAAIATAKGFLTSEDVAAINSAVEDLKAAEEVFLTANLPVEADTYYVYNPLTQKFLSRGNAWGTSAVVDDYGVAVKVAVADLPSGAYTLTGFDNNTTYGDDAWMYADAGGNRARSYIFTQVEGGYTMTNTNNSMLVYVYMKEDGDKFRVAGNAIKGDNYSDDAQTVWQLIKPADRDVMIAAREAAAKTAAFASAGIAEDAVLIEGDATEVSFTSGNAWTQTVVRTQDGQPATNENGTEMWQATGNYTQTIAELPSGLYKVSIQAFYRNGISDEDVERVATGYNTVLAYLEANGNKAQVKSWTSDKGEGNDPNSMSAAKAKFDEGKYLSEFYTYVGEDGLLNLKVDNPAHIGNGWFIVGNVKYAKVEAEVIVYPETESTVAAPQFSVAAGTYYEAQTVELTAEEGAEIYYVLDDSQLSSKSTKYTEPIAVTEATTIRAFAVKDGQGSAEAQVAYVFGQTADDIAAFKALEQGTTAQLTLTDAVVTVANGKNIFIEDATGGICFYNTGLELKKGDKLNGTIIGKVAAYNSLPELTAVAETSLDKVVITEDGVVTPAVVTIEDACTMTYAARMITIKTVTVTVEGNKTYVSDGVNTLQIYKQNSYGANFTMPEAGKQLESITGLLIPFNSTFEICPLTQDDIVEDNPTGINSMMAEGQKTIYNMKGQKMEKVKKGLNIINGKKVVVK
jgi:hypothetical protein